MAKIFEGLRHSVVDGGPEDPAAEHEADSSAAADPGALWGLPPLRGAHGEQLHSDDGDFQEDAAARPSGAAAKKKASKAVESPPTCN